MLWQKTLVQRLISCAQCSPTHTGIPHVHPHVLTTSPPTAGFPAGRSALAQPSTHGLKVSSLQPSSLMHAWCRLLHPFPKLTACPGCSVPAPLQTENDTGRTLHSFGGFMDSEAFPNKCWLRRTALGSDRKLNPTALSKYWVHKTENQLCEGR